MGGGTPRPGVPVRGSTSGRPVMAALDLRLLTLREDGYHLTQLGGDLVDALQPLDAWSRRWAEEADAGPAQGSRHCDE